MSEELRRSQVEDLLRVAAYARIAHHIPGRIRVKLPLAAKKALEDVEMDELAHQLPGIRDYRLNRRNGSLVIEYDTERISHQLWERLIQAQQEERHELIEELLALWDNA